MKAIVVLFVILLDVAINYILIKKKIKPNHVLATILRSLIVIPLLWDQDLVSWIGHVLTVAVIYSFLFDLILNLLRGESIMYIGIEDQRSLWNIILSYDGSFSLINQIQLKTVGVYPAFCFRAILFIFCTTYFLNNFSPYL